VVVSAASVGSSMNVSRASGRHHVYGRATIASTHTAITSSVISADVQACVCSTGAAARPRYASR
jgi:hypothetical protein